MISAIVLAGGEKKGLLGPEQVIQEALIPIGKGYMINFVLDALRQANTIQDIVVAGPFQEIQDVLENTEKIRVVQGGDCVTESVRRALSLLDERTTHVLVATADIPLLTAEAVNGFVKSCLEQEGDLFYPIISRTVIESRYLGVRRTYVPLKEGVFTGGNIFLVKASHINLCLLKAEDLIALRKKPWKLAYYVGLDFCLRYLMKRLSVVQAEQRVSRILGVEGRAMITVYPEIGIDIDKASDYEMVNHIISGLGLEKHE